MTLLHTPPLSALLTRLHGEADATQATLQQTIRALAPDDRRDLMARAQSDYKTFYAQAKDFHLAVSRETATLLYMLARATKAQAVVEFGTSFAVSTIYLAAAVRENGGGLVVTSEFEPSKVIRARANLGEAGLTDIVDVREGDALETLARDLPPTIDMVLLDGAKSLYPRILSLLERHLREGAIVVADNADASPEYLAYVRSPANGYVTVPFGAEVEVSMRVPLRSRG
jgi:predicted O-methyltransferase YrrM